MNRRTLACLLALAPLVIAADLPPHVAADPKAAIVTQQTLLASDRFWPYRVKLETPFARPSGAPLAAGETGVLIRVQSAEFARVDFGRDGLFDVPIASTDLVASANRIRAGQEEKLAPHFVYTIAPRLLDPVAHRVPDVASLSRSSGVLAVFADPAAKDFAARAHELAALQNRAGVTTIFFPLGRHPDGEVSAALVALSWPVLFVRDHLSEAYAQTLLDSELATPSVILQTNEGRVLYEAGWSADLVAKLKSEIDASFISSARAN